MAETTQQKINYPATIPHLVVNNGEEALEFYEKSLNATIIQKCYNDNKKLLHSVVTLPNGGMVFVCDDFPEFGPSRLLPKDHTSPVTIHLHFETQSTAQQFWDSYVKKNENDCFKIVMEFKPQYWKECFGAFRDKYQHSWSVGSPLNDEDKEANKENCTQTSKKRKTMDETAIKECIHCDDEPALKRKPEPRIETVSDDFIKTALAESQNGNENHNSSQHCNGSQNHNGIENHNGNENNDDIDNDTSIANN